MAWSNQQRQLAHTLPSQKKAPSIRALKVELPPLKALYSSSFLAKEGTRPHLMAQTSRISCRPFGEIDQQKLRAEENGWIIEIALDWAKKWGNFKVLTTSHRCQSKQVYGLAIKIRIGSTSSLNGSGCNETDFNTPVLQRREKNALDLPIFKIPCIQPCIPRYLHTNGKIHQESMIFYVFQDISSNFAIGAPSRGSVV